MKGGSEQLRVYVPFFLCFLFVYKTNKSNDHFNIKPIYTSPGVIRNFVTNANGVH